MMEKTSHIVNRMLCWILLLQLMNVSINMPRLSDPPSFVSATEKDFSVNEIETIYELIAEGVYGTDVPETDEEEIDNCSQMLELFYFEAADKLPPSYTPLAHFPKYQEKYLSIHKQPHSPPPKV